jgi:hypothetical protein
MSSHENGQLKRSDDWHTPPEIIAAFPPFDLDPCASDRQTTRTARRLICWPNNGLLLPWEGSVWLNPPYGAGTVEAWLEKMVSHADGVVLLPARVETAWFHRYIWGCANGIFFFRGRPGYVEPDKGGRGRARMSNGPFPSVMASYGERCREWLRDTALRGIFVPLEPKATIFPLFAEVPS